jgi:hypothetical protein
MVSTLSNYSDNHKHHIFKSNAGVPPYLLIKYLRFQLSAVYSGPKKNEIT